MGCDYRYCLKQRMFALRYLGSFCIYLAFDVAVFKPIMRRTCVANLPERKRPENGRLGCKIAKDKGKVEKPRAFKALLTSSWGNAVKKKVAKYHWIETLLCVHNIHIKRMFPINGQCTKWKNALLYPNNLGLLSWYTVLL